MDILKGTTMIMKSKIFHTFLANPCGDTEQAVIETLHEAGVISTEEIEHSFIEYSLSDEDEILVNVFFDTNSQWIKINPNTGKVIKF